MVETTDAAVVVAVVDSGWSRRAPDRRVRRGIGLVAPDDDLRVAVSEDDDDRLGHGTACADLVLRIAPTAAIVPVRVFGTRLETSVGTLVAALDWVRAAGLRLANLSVGTWRMDEAVPLYAACERFRRAGGIIVAAHPAGARCSLPAAFDNVISVTGTVRTADGLVRIVPGRRIEVVAAGAHADVRWCDGARRSVRGSSYAAPVVTGMIARLLERRPRATIDDARTFLDNGLGMEPGA